MKINKGIVISFIGIILMCFASITSELGFEFNTFQKILIASSAMLGFFLAFAGIVYIDKYFRIGRKK